MVVRSVERALLHCLLHYWLICTIEQCSSSLFWAPIPYVSTDVETEVKKISECVLNKVSNLDLVNIVDLMAMNWAILQYQISGSIASSLIVTCTSPGGNWFLVASSSLTLSSLWFFFKYNSTSIPSVKREKNNTHFLF